ncbi:MAG: bifunctional transaldolase/phosoglucose isomerase [Gammaproteobacteria bacterium]
MKPLDIIQASSQSLWLDYIRRGILVSGTLDEYIRTLGIRGLTSNPTIFDHAIAESSDYDAAIEAYDPSHGQTIEDLFFTLAIEDLQNAADRFRSIYDASQGTDGFVSLEVSPRLADDTPGTLLQAKKLHRAVSRPNLLIKVPGTPAGVSAITELIADGISVNVTLLFSESQYRAAADAYLKGLEIRQARKLPLNIASVASLFISRWDTLALARKKRSDPNLLGLAIARTSFAAYEALYQSERWRILAKQGAHPQRLLWASTGTKDPALPPTYYVDRLIAPQTINTVPEATLLAFSSSGDPQPLMPLTEARSILDRAHRDGIDLEAWGLDLQIKGRDSFIQSFDDLLKQLTEKTRKLGHATRSQDALVCYQGSDRDSIRKTLKSLGQEKLTNRLWQRDFTLWHPSPDEIVNRMGWLETPQYMMEHLSRLETFTDAVIADGIREVLWCGMGGSSLFPLVVEEAFANPKTLRIRVLDTSHPVTLKRVFDSYDPKRTLIVIASKSGTTLETRSQLELFWSRDPTGSHYVAITDPGTELAALAETRGFRALFQNDPNLGGRYSALSYFGLVALALKRGPVAAVLHAAQAMAEACAPCVPAEGNPGLALGTLLGTSAHQGRDKCTLILPEPLSHFGGWLEQLLAESTGKSGRGIIPVTGEALGKPDCYGSDRLFVTLTSDTPQLEAIAQSSQPLLKLPTIFPERLGAEVFRWEFATAIAGHLLAINPFDQPNVEAAKKAAWERLSHGGAPIPIEPLSRALQEIRAGDYLVLQAYIDLESPLIPKLEQIRTRFRDHYRIATQFEIGPRYLHSTGQLHKGGPRTGLFIQCTDAFDEKLPIPGRSFGFRELIQAQADGDYAALKTHGMRVFRTPIDEILSWH